MFSRAFKSTIIVSVVASLGIAKGIPTSDNNSQCDTGTMQCCNQVLDPNTDQAMGLLGILDLLGLERTLGNVGLDCSPINVLGIGNGASCGAQAVCCTDVAQDGLVNLGCSPINLGL